MASEAQRLITQANAVVKAGDRLSARFARRLQAVLRDVERELARLPWPTAGNTLAERVSASQQLRAEVRRLLTQGGYPQLIQSATADPFTTIASQTTRAGLAEALPVLQAPAQLEALRVLHRAELLNQGRQVAEALEQAASRAVIGGQTRRQGLDDLTRILDRSRAQVATLYDTSLSVYGREAEALQAGDNPEALFVYLGPVDGRTRPWCLRHAGRVYTRREINKLDSPLGSPFLTAGGYNCRHIWSEISPASELAKLHESKGRLPEMRDDLQRVGGATVIAQKPVPIFDFAQNLRLQTAMLGKTPGAGANFKVIGDKERFLAKQKVAHDLAPAIFKHPQFEAAHNWLAQSGVIPARLNARALTLADAEDVSSALVKLWAKTSADSDPLSLAFQRAVQAEFKIGAGSLAHRATEIAAQTRAIDAIEDSFGGVLRTFTRAQYDQTQAWLKQQGITHVSVHRGMLFRGRLNNPLITPTPKVFRDIAGGAEGATRLPVTMQPASSWAADVQEAQNFAGATTRASKVDRVMQSVNVPASRVLSTARTGVGCLSESECVLLGGDLDVFVTLNHVDGHSSSLGAFLAEGR